MNTAVQAPPPNKQNRGFVQIADLFQQEQIRENTRTFMGEGTLFLKVPGLKKLEAVYMGNQQLHRTEVRRYPIDPNHTQFENDELPLIQFTHLPDGTPVLLRSVVTNDGVWQSQAFFSVQGEWDETVPAPEIPVEEVKLPKKGTR
jgi:hypothetical protein